ncbi:MAG: response regulator [Oscillochloris sp.]|nr:response regulator [Oscillochloris sp.]
MAPQLLHVLIVDASREDQLSLRQLLTHYAPGVYSITEASRGDRALAICQTAPPDCVLLDYSLPDLDGLAVLAALRIFTDVPVILLTDIGSNIRTIEALQQGAQDSLDKDALTPERLHLAIQHTTATVRLIRERDQALALLTTTLDIIPIGVAVLDSELRIEHMNPALAKLLGYPAGLLHGQSLLTYWPDLAATLAPSCTHVLHGESFHDLEIYEPSVGTREERWLSFSGIPVHTTKGANLRGLITVQDITRLRGHNQILESLTFTHYTPDQPTYPQNDRMLAQDLADHSKLTLYNAQLHQEVQIAQQIAAEAHARLDAFVSSAPSGIGYLDHELRYQLVNPALAAITGKSPADYLGRKLDEMLPCLASQLEPLVRHVLMTGKAAQDIELHGNPCLHDMIAHSWLVSYFPIPGPKHEIVGVGLLLSNITTRKQIEEELRRSAERLQTLHTIDRAILIAETPEHIASIVASRLQQLIGCERVVVAAYDREQQYIQNLAIIDIRSDRQALGQRIPIVPIDLVPPFALDQHWYMPDTEHGPDLSPRAIKHYAFGFRSILHFPLVAEGQLLGLLRLGREVPNAFNEADIIIAGEVADQLAIVLRSARLHAQIEQERAQLAQRVTERTSELSMANAELARAARLKDEFLANMSHELRTPLSAILGRAELLGDQIYGPLTEKQQQAIHSIEESGRHLLTLINDILDLSKIEAGKADLQFAPVEVDLICQQSRRLVTESAMQKRISLYTTLDPQVTTLQADELRLKQILVNLLVNAVKFTPESGKVGMEVQGDPEHQRVTFTIWDTGIGIAPEEQPRLFKPFVQIDSALSRQYAGTGLGLALVMRLAELHGGSVALDSKPGVGSRFSVILPWVWPEDGSTIFHPPTAMASTELISVRAEGIGTRPTILLAEDHEANIQLLSDTLTAAGYTVTVARNGAEALAQAEDIRPALILMDIQMPVMDGLEVTRRLRATGFHNTPIIALTALTMEGDRERCLAAGASEYLSKPVSLRLLLNLIRAQLQQTAKNNRT